jgi:hypothetical protein
MSSWPVARHSGCTLTDSQQSGKTLQGLNIIQEFSSYSTENWYIITSIQQMFQEINVIQSEKSINILSEKDEDLLMLNQEVHYY